MIIYLLILQFYGAEVQVHLTCLSSRGLLRDHKAKIKERQKITSSQFPRNPHLVFLLRVSCGQNQSISQAGLLSGNWERIYFQAHTGCGQIQIIEVIGLRSPFHPGRQPEAAFSFWKLPSSIFRPTIATPSHSMLTSLTSPVCHQPGKTLI